MKLLGGPLGKVSTLIKKQQEEAAGELEEAAGEQEQAAGEQQEAAGEQE